MKNLPELFGDGVWLGNFQSENTEFLKKYFSWLHNPKAEPFIGPVSETTIEKVRQMLLENQEDETIKHWCVYLGDYPSKRNPVGDFSLKTLDSKSEFAEYDPNFSKFPSSEELTILIGQEYSGAGLGTKAMVLALNHSFGNGTDAVYLGVYTANPAKYLYQKCGFATLLTLQHDTDLKQRKEELIMRLTPKEWNVTKSKL